MDYPRAKFGDFSFSRFHFIVRTDTQTNRITEADQRYTHATTVGVSIQATVGGRWSQQLCRSSVYFTGS